MAKVLLSCREAPKEEPNAENSVSENAESAEPRFTNALQQVFQAHGGLESWRQQRYLAYEIPKGSAVEKHHIDLNTRMDLIETEDYQMGFDGDEVWIRDPQRQYKGDPVFYHNLMFYFYAMPFVLADPGIVYFEIKPLVYGGKSYPGIGIRYKDGIGTSPEDEYFLYYDADSFEMAWLGYTVTYRTGKPSDDVHWIRYDNWVPVSGLRLPASMTWYTLEDGVPSSSENTLRFEQVALSDIQADPSMFAMPEGGEVREAVRNGQ